MYRSLKDFSVVSDRKLPQYQGNVGVIAYYEADQLSLKLYDPFGTIAQEWRITGTYRYSFNGKESDSEWDGGGAMFDYGFRIYDPRLCRFLSVDPLTESYPWYTPYQFAGNIPIACIDLDGLEQAQVNVAAYIQSYFEKGRKLAEEGFKWFGWEYVKAEAAVIGIDNAYILFTGLNLDAEESSRALAAGWLVVDLAGGKLYKGPVKILGRYTDEFVKATHWVLKDIGLKTFRYGASDLPLLKGNGYNQLKDILKDAKNNLDHLTDKDISGFIKELHGLQIPNPTKPGKFYQHEQEVRDALKGLTNRVKELQEGIQGWKWKDGQRYEVDQFTDEVLNTAKEALSHYSKELGRLKNIIKGAEESAKLPPTSSKK